MPYSNDYSYYPASHHYSTNDNYNNNNNTYYSINDNGVNTKSEKDHKCEYY